VLGLRGAYKGHISIVRNPVLVSFRNPGFGRLVFDGLVIVDREGRASEFILKESFHLQCRVPIVAFATSPRLTGITSTCGFGTETTIGACVHCLTSEPFSLVVG
jgi:hypothetical protein